jgi:NhaP-type Na+/H+ or K+/H+ antiporter
MPSAFPRSPWHDARHVVRLIVAVLAVGFLVYRLLLTFRSMKARRAGDREHADELRTRSTMAFLGMTGLFTLALLVLAAVAIARSS